MNTIEKKLAELPYQEMPDGLHARIIRKVIIMNLRVPFLIVLSLLFISLAASSWHLWMRLAENEALSIFKTLIMNLEFDSESLISAVQTMSEVISPLSFLIFLTNIALVGYLIYIYVIFNRMSKNGIIFGQKN